VFALAVWCVLAGFTDAEAHVQVTVFFLLWLSAIGAFFIPGHNRVRLRGRGWDGSSTLAKCLRWAVFVATWIAWTVFYVLIESHVVGSGGVFSRLPAYGTTVAFIIVGGWLVPVRGPARWVAPFILALITPSFLPAI